MQLEKASQSNNAAIAQIQRTREWERLMGVDMSTSTTGFADPGESMTPHSRRVGGEDRPDTDDMDLDLDA
ncbi:hypothetical protein EV580_1311 [Mycobacterium sp. BK086]|uniref:hypothetical protein n=1 Tax=Mycobacterium sp. BK086 TaxID=2512165 RepID=UPI00105F54F4|nr:hypothetical protein [Mycobacterium sp. BK086]TDO18129.1 hypothetical protein EV580_1311 [Mycobacterium sp. BK086]